MKRKNAFTLIELLAVIVILAVIALIATPLVMNTINDAREGALKSTARNIIEIAETEYQKKLIDDPNTIPSIDFNTLSYKGEKVDAINGSFNEDGTANVAIYKGNKCIYRSIQNKDVILEKDLTKENCLKKIGSSLVEALINQSGTSADTTEGFQDKGNGVYTYTGASGIIGTNYLWYGGHLWRIMKIEGDKLTLITSYPVTSIAWGSSVANQPSLETSYVGDWLNNVFLKSLPSNVQNKLENMTYKRDRYDGTTMVTDEIKSDVKVRLLTWKEYKNYSGQNKYLDIEDCFWLADIYSLSGVRYVFKDGSLYDGNPAANTNGVRPVIEVSNLMVTKGEGILTNPYIVEEKVIKTTTEIQIGEYVSIPKNDGSVYLSRVIKQDETGTKVILNGLYTTSEFGDSPTFSSSSTVYTGALTTFKNTLDPTYFDNTDRTFQIMMYGDGIKYDSDASTYINDINIGLPSVGEIFSGNDIDLSTSLNKVFVDSHTIENGTNSDYYWLMNAYNSSYVRSVNINGTLGYSASKEIRGVRPTWYIKNSNIIGGTGTVNDPYQLK